MPIDDCRAALEANELVLENSRIRRRLHWNGGHPVSTELVDKRAAYTWKLGGTRPDFELPGLQPTPDSGEFRVQECPETKVAPAHLAATLDAHWGELAVRRRFRIYPGCPAIACDIFVRGSVPTTGDPPPLDPEQAAPVLDRLSTGQLHLDVTSVEFRDATDVHNTLVYTHKLRPFRFGERAIGNLLLASSTFDEGGFFLLKEASCSNVQLAWPGFDFVCAGAETLLVGLGISPDAVLGEAWTRCYGAVLGVACGGSEQLLEALRDYQSRLRRMLPERDEMILANTWGDRSQDQKISEEWVKAELDACAHYGVTHLQLDCGWQRARWPEPGTVGPILDRIWERDDYWEVHPERFPEGLGPVIDHARKCGVELGLWFNPCKTSSHESWRRDAEVMIDLYRRHGIRTWKIDGTNMPDKASEQRLRAMLDAVTDATDGEAVFNLDITAGRRYGYFDFAEYGNYFLENRYTDWSNYYPHWTLRNLWMLSAYVPPQRLQIEWLNKWRNPSKYDALDPLAPRRVPFEYCFAVTMAAQPLAWFEVSGLPPEAEPLAEVIGIYRELMTDLHAGMIFPIGERPDGSSWTGFQSVRGPDSGYFIVYRELNDRPEAALKLWNLRGRDVRCKALLGRGQSFEGRVSEEGRLRFALPEGLTYAVYGYGSG